MFPDAKQALCAYHVRTAIQKTLQQKLKGAAEQRKAAFSAIEGFVTTIMYLRPEATVEATQAEAQRRFVTFRDECVANDSTKRVCNSELPLPILGHLATSSKYCWCVCRWQAQQKDAVDYICNYWGNKIGALLL